MPEPIELSSTKIKVEHVDFKTKNVIGLNEKSPGFESEAFNERVCENHDVTSQSLADPAIKYNTGNAMFEGYFGFPRALISNEIWKSLSFEYRHVFLTIMANCVYEEKEMNDHGELFMLKPGQYMTTERELAKKCDEPTIDSSLIHRCFLKFEKLGFSKQEVKHKKTIITIIQKDYVEMIEARIEAKSKQDRSKIEAQTKRQEDNNIKKQPQTPVAVFYKSLEKEDLTDEEKRVMTTYPEDRVISAIEYSKVVPFNESLIQQLRWHCLLPEAIKAKKPIQQEVREIFKHGEIYNGAYCWYTEDCIAFERGTKNFPVKWSDKSFRKKFEETIKIFEIKEWK